jgi:hypothetical protein
MLFAGQPHRFTTWLALWAVVIAALLPLASQAAVQHTSRAQWIEVCGNSGLIWVRAEVDASDPAQDKADHLSAYVHCEGCLSQPWALGVASADGTAWFPPRVAQTLPSQAESAARSRGDWHPAQSRAPPAPDLAGTPAA